jgi:16S rRNA (cytosine1402-N4)-methyltransferase
MSTSASISSSSLQHITVLRQEAVDALQIQAAPQAGRPDRSQGHYVDATYGRGGHSNLILSQLSSAGRLTVFDKDPEAAAHARALQDPRLHFIHDSFAALANLPDASLDGLLMDLGVSSPQIDNAERGFSFRQDGPLDMRMDSSRGLSVADWLASADVQAIADVIKEFGEERFAWTIANKIVERRQSLGPLTRTLELAQLVATVVKREPGQDPATRTFQALRIFINRELQDLETALAESLRVLKPGGRLAVISFHSLEDRRVKNFIAEHAREQFDRLAPFAAPKPLLFKSMGRIKPTAAEIAANPRSRSAVLRVAERTEQVWQPVAGQGLASGRNKKAGTGKFQKAGSGRKLAEVSA